MTAWQVMPLPSLMLDGAGCVADVNDAAEIWLNLSRNALIGRGVDSGDLAARLRIVPPLAPLAARVLAQGDSVVQPGVWFGIGDRAGGHQARIGAVHAAPGDAPNRVMIVIVPQADHAAPAPRAARSAIGMAEMLAHEIKNPLAGIRGAAQLMAMNVGPEDREMADMIVAESRRIVALLDQVERFGDTRPPQRAAVNVHDVLEQVRRNATAGFAQGVRMVTDYDPSLPPALADADQLMQVCLNLVKNAAEAGATTIRLRTFYDHARRMATGPVPLQIEIDDNGPGLPAAIADQVFDPFVSGRENGTGLGLALVSKIITDHDALIRVDSQPGRTVFRISLAKA
ncbi:nitrogen regulation protein NR(II) [Paracoccus sp. (in: a-proteobacteria)]|uniref:two-component system sensor histidine kinase NtrB n=1 Tax=Paracoccus sp. TaxID=267 RepID=UPI0026E01273|nr:ATP-binding protein [Paracoccus sp. (in: a-proteobacteria)]MDO5647829.1 ATP-binding protein [Paracoccus sp. (in: a-proteobacteria)]